MIEPFIQKASSGRFWLTIISGITFAWAVMNKVMPPEATASIITMVFVSYFQKNGDKQ